MTLPPSTRSPSWWSYPMVWVVIAGPLLVVIAGVITAWIAISGADQVVKAPASGAHERPALQGRNHAATPAKDAAGAVR